MPSMGDSDADSASAGTSEPDPRETKAAAKQAARVERDAAKAAKREAKALARARRAEQREQATAAKVEARRAAAAAKAAERVDTKTAEQESQERHHDDVVEPAAETVDDSEIFEPVRFDDEPTAQQTVVQEAPILDDVVVEAEPVVEEDEPVLVDEGPADEAPADQAPADQAPAEEKSDVRAEARAAVARHRVDARRRQAEAKQARLDAKAAAATKTRPATKDSRKVEAVPDDDHIVEPPRAPKLSFAERRRQAKADRADERAARPASPSTTRPAPGGGGGRGRLLALLAGTVGAVGLICSVVLAIGALLVALGADQSSAYDLVSGVCDVLVGPLGDVFSFSGANAEMKESLVAWGAGSIAYLLVGLVAQSLLRPSSKA